MTKKKEKIITAFHLDSTLSTHSSYLSSRSMCSSSCPQHNLWLFLITVSEINCFGLTFFLSIWNESLNLGALTFIASSRSGFSSRYFSSTLCSFSSWIHAHCCSVLCTTYLPICHHFQFLDCNEISDSQSSHGLLSRMKNSNDLSCCVQKLCQLKSGRIPLYKTKYYYSWRETLINEILKFNHFGIEIVIIEDKYLSLFDQLHSQILMKEIRASYQLIKSKTDAINLNLFFSYHLSCIPNVKFSFQDNTAI